MHKLLLAAVLSVLSLPVAANAQQDPSQGPSRGPSIQFGADLVSRYVVRGLAFGTSPSIQPSAALSAGRFDAGTWGNYGLSGDEGNGAEQDFWVGYTLDRAGLGVLRVSLFDYHFPEAGRGFFDVQGGGDGGHFVEAQVHLAAAKAPVYLFAGRHLHNDPDGSWYVEAGVTPRVADVELSLSAGAAGGGSAWYGTDGRGFSLINTSLRLARTVPLTEAFALPLHATLVVNPATERAYFVFGFSL